MDKMIDLVEIPQSYSDDLKKFTQRHNEFLEGKIDFDTFKAVRVPFGVYQQRDGQKYMMRIRSTAGVISAKALCRIIDIAIEYSSERLHFTTRQEIQVHDLEISDVSDVALKLFEVGISIKGGGGNTVRNITADIFGVGEEKQSVNVQAAAILLANKLLNNPVSFSLPRKFKIAFSYDSHLFTPAMVADLGFVAVSKNGQVGFKVFVAGGLGSNPAPAILAKDFLEIENIYLFALALIEMFNELGQRQNRHAARVRHLAAKMGEDEFLSELEKRYRALKNLEKGTEKIGFEATEKIPKKIAVSYQKSELNLDSDEFSKWKQLYVNKGKTQDRHTVMVAIDAGMVEPKKFKAFARFLEKLQSNSDILLSLTREQNIVVEGVPQDFLEEFFCEYKAYIELTKVENVFERPLWAANMISCAGASMCQLGICNSRALYGEILKESGKFQSGDSEKNEKLKNFRIHISGCPNSCGLHQIANLGFSGKAAYTKNGQLYPAYAVFSEAGLDETGKLKLGKQCGQLPAFKIVDFVKYLFEKDIENIVGSENLLAGVVDDFNKIIEHTEIPLNDWGDPVEKPFSVEKRGKGECSAGISDIIEGQIAKINSLRKSFKENPQQSAAASLVSQVLTVVLASVGEFSSKANEKNQLLELFETYKPEFKKYGFDHEEYEKIYTWLKQGHITMLTEEEFFAKILEFSQTATSFASALAYGKLEPVVITENRVKKAEPANVYDLRGVGCPMNFVKVKMKLATMKSGDEISVYLDDGAPIENVPLSVEEDGHKVLEKEKKDAGHWLVVIKKGN